MLTHQNRPRFTGHRPEIRARALLDRLPEGDVIGVEVGVFRGEMSAELLRRPGLFLYMVDPWESSRSQPKHPRRRATQEDIYREARSVTAFAVLRRSIIRGRSLDAALAFKDGSLDFVFIDADHSYEAVRADIAAWTPKLKPGGLLSGHDYSPPGWYSARGWPGVVRAVDEFVSTQGLSLELGDNQTWFVELGSR